MRLKRVYFLIAFQILALILFLSAHFIETIYYLGGDKHYAFGLLLEALLVDVYLYFGIGFQILSILIIVSLEIDNIGVKE